MRSLCRSRRLATLFTLALAGCAGPTELVVVVDSDMTIPSELDEVRLTVTGPAGTPASASQRLGGAGNPALPLTVAVRPSGDALGPITLVAEGLRGGTVEVTRSARTSLVRGESRMIVLMLLRTCRGVDCDPGRTCTGDTCEEDRIAPEDLPIWTGDPRADAGRPPGMDGGASDGGARDGGGDDGGGPGDAGGRDAGPPMRCETGSDCDDRIDCTLDVCTDGECSHRPDDARCTAEEDGVCDAIDGCQYAECTATNCVAGPCQTAACEGNRCRVTDLCGAGQSCCAGACVRAGCDDDNPCTDDSCGASGCVNANHTRACDDGVFCNGTDTCAGGSCATHAGNPCSGSAVCDESSRACTGCLVDADCGMPVYGTWGACTGFSGTCGQTGTETRSVTTFRCQAGSCVPSVGDESRACTRNTNGTTCAATTCDMYGACNYGSACANSGTRTRTCTDHACSSGACAPSTRMESMGCSRDTNGTMCSATSCGGWSGCSYPSTCANSGSETRTCTDFACSGGTCGGTMRTEMRGCTRNTNGTMCAATSCGSYGSCTYASTCSQTGTATRTCTDFACAMGMCASSSRMESSGAPCGRMTNGNPCDDGDACTQFDECSGGWCSGAPTPCSGGCVCDPATGACVHPMGFICNIE